MPRRKDSACEPWTDTEVFCGSDPIDVEQDLKILGMQPTETMENLETVDQETDAKHTEAETSVLRLSR